MVKIRSWPPSSVAILRLVAAVLELLREDQPVAERLLGQQARLAGLEQVALVADRLEAALRHRPVEADQDLVALDDVALVDQQLVDDAALEVLQGLAVALDPHRALGHGRAGQRRQAGPGAEAAEEQHDDQHAGGDEAAERRLARGHRRAGGPGLMLAATVAGSPASATGTGRSAIGSTPQRRRRRPAGARPAAARRGATWARRWAW